VISTTELADYSEGPWSSSSAPTDTPRGKPSRLVPIRSSSPMPHVVRHPAFNVAGAKMKRVITVVSAYVVIDFEAS
jgi:hypothetical protein